MPPSSTPNGKTHRHHPSSMDSNPTIDELANYCFGCGPGNPNGLHLAFTMDASDPDSPLATAQVNLDRSFEGPPGHIHGGIIATLMDEAMSKLNRPLNVLAMTRHMEVDYLRPAPLHQPLILIGRHQKREGRKLFHAAELKSSDGTLLASAKGLFIVIDPSHLKPASQRIS